MRLSIAWLAITLAASPATADSWEETPTVRAMKDETARSIDKLELAGFGKPYFVSYLLDDGRSISVEASLGALIDADDDPSRRVDTDLRVGDYALDNSNMADRDGWRNASLPIEDDYDVIRRFLWIDTDREYKQALEALEKKRAIVKAETRTGDEVASFSTEPATHITDEDPTPAFAKDDLAALAKKLSAVFRTNADAYTGTVRINAKAGRRVFISSEGSAATETYSYVRIVVTCSTQTADGMQLVDTRAFYAKTLDALPSEASLVKEVEALSSELSALRAAPIVDDYGGPILITDLAAAQAVRALLADDLAGTPASTGGGGRFPGSEESELVGKVGQRILPAGTSIVDDPTQARVGKTDLAGTKRFDAEGIPSQKVSLVENGVLKGFVMSRIPRKGFEHSTGHAASTLMSGARASPANLILAAKKGLSDKQIRKRALAIAKEQGLDHVIVIERFDTAQQRFDEIGFDFDPDDMGGLPRPSVMKRLYADGREELVRGGKVRSVSLRSLRDLVAIGSTPSVYTYASSGMSMLPVFMGDSDWGTFVSISAPALLFRDAEVKKPTGKRPTPPVVPRPAPP